MTGAGPSPLGAVEDVLRAELTGLLGPGGVLTAPEDRARFETGWRYGAGSARLVARPDSTAGVAATLQACARHGVRVVPQGANTGLVGASNPDASGAMVVLSLERFAATIEVDAAARTVLVDGGVTLSRLNEALRPHGLWFPVDLGADPQVAGMVATNTGGTRLLRYGDVRHNLLGVEAVLADGTVVDALSRLRKNNTGLDCKQLFVGTAGVFGVVTRAVLAVAPLPRQRVTAMVGCVDGAAVLGLLAALEAAADGLLSAFEVIGREALRPVFVHQPSLRDPFAGDAPAYAVLVELSTTLPPEQLSLDDVLEGALGGHLEAAGDAVTEIVVGNKDELWQIRHHISESLRGTGRMLAFDVSVPRSRLPQFTAAVRDLLLRDFPFVRLCDYGHWGDGGTHLNLLWSDDDIACAPEELVAQLQPRIYDLAVRGFLGSYSAEHGIGPHNQAFYERYTDPAVRELCGALRERCDPQRLLGRVRLD